MDDELPGDLDPENLEGYRGRWVAVSGNRIIAQGGTPQQAERSARVARFKEIPRIMYVPTGQEFEFPPIVFRLRELLAADQEIFLVGGVVRDALLGRSSKDIDIVLPSKALEKARTVANQLGGAFFPLNEEFDAGRVILTDDNDQRMILDFTGMRGASLEDDLRARDFTINAMAVNLHDLDKPLDPMGGARDLIKGEIRACSSTSFESDPIRILRAVRQAAEYKFKIAPDTRALMRNAASRLPDSSQERQRDELFRILDGAQPAAALRALDILGVLPYLLPEIAALKGVQQTAPHSRDVFGHTLSVLQNLATLLNILGPAYDPEGDANNLIFGLAVLNLGRFREHFSAHLKYHFTPERTARALLFMAALYHDCGKPVTFSRSDDGRIRFFKHDIEGATLARQRGNILHLSNEELQRLTLTVKHHMRPLLLTNSNQKPTRKAIYRFFRDAGVSGVDICLLSLADFLGTYGTGVPQDLWAHHLETVRSLLSAWWEHPAEEINPPLFLNGKEIIEIFSIEQGPLIGKVLKRLHEAQAVGEVTSRDEAMRFVESYLAGTQKPDGE